MEFNENIVLGDSGREYPLAGGCNGTEQSFVWPAEISTDVCSVKKHE